ncbi:MAG: EAL domain-containing protein [Saccharospirillum sp.]
MQVDAQTQGRPKRRLFELKFVTRIALLFGALGLMTLLFSMLYSVRTAQTSLETEIYNTLQQQHRTIFNQFESRLALLDVYLQSAAANRLYSAIAEDNANLDALIEDMAFMFQDSALGTNLDIFFITDSRKSVLMDAGLPLYPIADLVEQMRPPIYYTNQWHLIPTAQLTALIKSVPIFDPASLQLRGYIVIGFAIGQNRLFLSELADQAGVDVVKLGLGGTELLRHTSANYTGIQANRGIYDRVIELDNMYLLSRPLTLGRGTESLWVEVGISAERFASVAELHQRPFFLLSGGFLLLLGMATWLVHLNHSRSINGLLKYITDTQSGTRNASFEPSGIYEYNQVGFAMQNMVRDLNVAATVFESAQGMVVTDEHTRILRVNQAFQHMTGLSDQDVIGRPLNLIQAEQHEEDINTEIEQALIDKGNWQGEAWGKRHNGEPYLQWMNITAVYTEDHQGVQNYVVTLIDTTERKAAEEKIEHLAFFDQLTSLPNRRLLLDRLSKALKSAHQTRQHGAILYIDLDDFKTLNDTKGHDIGDAFLTQVAERLNHCVRHTDTVARIGGDEFVVLLENLTEDAAKAHRFAESLAEKILQQFSLPFQVGGTEHFSTLSIGIALFDHHSIGVDELLKQADLAMYQAKAAGRNTHCFFDPQMQQRVLEHLAMANEIRVALKESQFELYLQPQVDREACILGAETLLRWNHPEKGLVGPADVITVAEETGLILPLGDWVLEQSCNILAQWQQDERRKALTLSVNISARQLHQSDFVQHVINALHRSGAPADRLKLELTESMLLEDVRDTIQKMQQLRKHGIGFALDDFGTGYSSLSYLKQLPLDQLKIDQTFVDDLISNPNDSDIAKTIVSLANGLNIIAIAEGVETSEQRDCLLGFGCHAFQGYYFGRPMPVKAFGALVMPRATTQ